MSDLPIFTREADDRIAELEAENAELCQLTKEVTAELEAENAKLREWEEEAIRLLRQVPPDRSWLSQFWIRDVKKLLGDRST
jgi:predicted nuclease with TOPRIM domain